MHKRRLTSRLAGSIAVVALLFANLAIAAYNCPMDTMLAEGCSMAMHEGDRSDSPVADPPGPSSLSSLCQAHCLDDQEQSSDGAPLLPPFAPAFVARLPDAVSVRPSLVFPAPELLRSTSPPPLIRNACFRI